MPSTPEFEKLSPALQKLQSGVLTTLGSKTNKVDLTKVVTQYSKGVLAQEKLNDQSLVGFSQLVSAELNNAKTLMNQLGYKDVTKAPAISVNQASLRVVPGQLKVENRVVRPPILQVSELHAVEAAPQMAKPVETMARPVETIAIWRGHFVMPSGPTDGSGCSSGSSCHAFWLDSQTAEGMLSLSFSSICHWVVSVAGQRISTGPSPNRAETSALPARESVLPTPTSSASRSRTFP